MDPDRKIIPLCNRLTEAITHAVMRYVTLVGPPSFGALRAVVTEVDDMEHGYAVLVIDPCFVSLAEGVMPDATIFNVRVLTSIIGTYVGDPEYAAGYEPADAGLPADKTEAALMARFASAGIGPMPTIAFGAPSGGFI